jgi:hypothetical protein
MANCIMLPCYSASRCGSERSGTLDYAPQIRACGHAAAWLYPSAVRVAKRKVEWLGSVGDERWRVIGARDRLMHISLCRPFSSLQRATPMS